MNRPNSLHLKFNRFNDLLRSPAHLSSRRGSSDFIPNLITLENLELITFLVD